MTRWFRPTFQTTGHTNTSREQISCKNRVEFDQIASKLPSKYVTSSNVIFLPSPSSSSPAFDAGKVYKSIERFMTEKMVFYEK